MKIIGNIAFKEKLVNHTKVDYINYVDLENGKNDLNKIDNNLPTLIVGWNLCKSYFPYHNHDGSVVTVSILEKEYIKNSRFWEFSFNENKAQHVSGVDMFVRNVPYYYFNQQIKYVNIDPIFKNINELSNLKTQLPKGSYEVYNHKNQMFYILQDKVVYGINIEMYNFFEFNIETIKEIILKKDNENDDTVSYIEDIDGSIYQEYYKILPYFEDLKRYLVVLLSKA